jgi:hypothetical protein
LRSMPPRLMAVAFAMFAMALTVLLPSPASAQTAGGGQTYGLGQAGSPAASDYLSAAQGFNSSLAPLLTAILPVLVVILAIWKGPMIFKKLVSMATRG